MEAVERTFRSWDGTELFYRAWLPNEKKIGRALLLFHRGHEHSGRWQGTVDSLGLEETARFSPGTRAGTGVRRENGARRGI